VSREIKFKVWDEEYEEFINEDECVFSNGTLFRNHKDYMNLISDDLTILQYTGLKDKAGVEIYEGDIFYDDADNHIGVVTFLNGAFVCESYFDGFEKEELEPSDNRCFLAERLIRDYGNVFEVIGNIYENKELLNETD